MLVASAAAFAARSGGPASPTAARRTSWRTPSPARAGSTTSRPGSNRARPAASRRPWRPPTRAGRAACSWRSARGRLGAAGLRAQRVPAAGRDARRARGGDRPDDGGPRADAALPGGSGGAAGPVGVARLPPRAAPELAADPRAAVIAMAQADGCVMTVDEVIDHLPDLGLTPAQMDDVLNRMEFMGEATFESDAAGGTYRFWGSACPAAGPPPDTTAAVEPAPPAPAEPTTGGGPAERGAAGRQHPARNQGSPHRMRRRGPVLRVLRRAGRPTTSRGPGHPRRRDAGQRGPAAPNRVRTPRLAQQPTRRAAT